MFLKLRLDYELLSRSH